MNRAPTLYLIRHAESIGNQDGIMQGAGEYPLSASGRAAAIAAGPHLRDLLANHIVSSDLSRAQDTAMLALHRVDFLDPRLRERAAGEWEGRPRAELEAAHPGALENDARRPPGFEPAAVVLDRMTAACVEMLDRGGCTVAVTHGAVLRILAASLGGGAERFGHLDGLVLTTGLRITDRCHFAVGLT